MSAKMKFVLVDANAVMHRAYHAIPPLTTKQGELVNMVYGFTSALLKVIKDLEPTHLAAAFDVVGGTFRNEKFAAYKAKRKKPEQEFYDQIPRAREVLDKMGIRVFEAQGFEADDVIGTLVQTIAHKNPTAEIFIVTGDMDALQLVGGAVKVYAFRRGLGDTVIYDAAKVKERYGITPNQVVDFKGLRGDTSDNIPGVKGIGDKGAEKLLQTFGSLKKIYETLESKDELPDVGLRVTEMLKNQKATALMSLELATIKCDVPLTFAPEECVWRGTLSDEARQLFSELEFFSLLHRLPAASGAVMNVSSKTATKLLAKKTEPLDFMFVDSREKLSALRAEIKRRQQCVFFALSPAEEKEQSSLEALFFIFPSKFFYVPVNDAFGTGTLDLFAAEKPLMDFLVELKEDLENEKFLKIGWEQKDDQKLLAPRGVVLRGLEFDVHLAAYLLNPGKREYVLDQILQERSESLRRVFVWRNEAEVPEEFKGLLKWAYLGELREILAVELKTGRMNWLFEKVEMPLVTMLAAMEACGVEVDVKKLRQASGKLNKELATLASTIHELSGNKTFNINSSQQLGAVLFEQMQLPTAGIKKNKTGFSVAAGELEKLREENAIINHIITYKELFKLKTTYVDALPKLLDPVTHRVHTTFHQTVTATGRLSSSNPNLQNIPVRTEAGKFIRRAFVAEKGRVLLSGDYSQIELRLVASLADDKKMQAIFAAGEDIHTATSAEINGVDLSEVSAQMRRAAKAINFGIIYGVSSFGLSNSAGISRAEAKDFIAKYLKNFSTVDAYLKRSKAEATRKGYAETLWGRRRYLPELKTGNAFLRQAAERMAINMPVQGTAADLMKICMLTVHAKVAEMNAREKDAVRVLLQVHDELVFSVRKDLCETVARELKPLMETAHENFAGRAMHFAVPIKVDFKFGENWEEMEKMDL